MISDSLLPVIWFFIISGELALYALLDGANLGIGLLSLLPQPEERRALMLHTLGPIWNANETWILVAAGSLFGAFPAVYSVALNALYIPGMIILIGIILRAVSFEFYDYSDSKKLWGNIFGFGSLFAVVGQGLFFGGILSGINVSGDQFAGGPFDWLTPITLLIAIGFFSSYVIVGYAYLIKRTEYQLSRETFPRILIAGLVTFVSLFGASLLLPNEQYTFMSRWTTAPTNAFLFGIAGCIAMLTIALGFIVLKKRSPKHIYTLCLSIFILGFGGMLIGVYPYMLPPSLSLFDAASPANTLRFMLYGIGPLLPIILTYNWYLAHVFRDESKKGEKELSGY